MTFALEGRGGLAPKAESSTGQLPQSDIGNRMGILKSDNVADVIYGKIWMVP